MVSKRAILAVLAAMVGMFGLVGPVPLDTASAAGVTYTVAIRNFAYNPMNVSIAAGDTVRWTNRDVALHTVTANDGSWGSGDLAQGQSYSHTFTTGGVFGYYCVYHGSPGNGQIGTVTVSGGGGGGTPSLAIADKKVTETDPGTTKTMAFSVTRTGDTAATSTVKFTTANGTAVAGSDYTAVSGKTLTFAAGVTVMKAKVKIIGDNLVEPNETLSVTLSAPSNATISDGNAVGTIVNDD